MIIVDTALKKREEQNKPVRVGLIGAGYMGRGTVLTIEKYIPGMRVAAIYNRSIERAEQAYNQAEVENFKKVDAPEEIDDIIEKGEYAITSNAKSVCRARNIDVIIEATGEIEFGAKIVLEALKNKKHVVLLNAELDATLGPILKTYADEQGVIITNADGDQPGVIMNLFRFVETIGYKPVLAGNIKGMEDAYRTPETQKAFAEKHNQKPKMVTSFADGTKLSMEMAVVANATGFKASKRGMNGPACDHVEESLELFSKEEMLDGGRIDYILGATPGPGVFVIGYNDHPILKGYMPVFKMGEGPFYLFYVPHHLPHLEVPLTAARAVLFNDATIAPKSKPVCEVITLAKKNIKAGEKLDGIGGFTCYGAIENFEIARQENLLPMGLSENCKVVRDVAKDQALTFDDVQLPEDSLAYNLWQKQFEKFS